ncbi:RNA 2',3'-cyclic phosphodiesterase [Niallia nealsonii]|uniref:RNA 2',3'-cyclic phosphodiesterase n=1 Tax=Niallia nealsonii TaxID=115979 RepID=A0A2N0Z640_9BACI|nr:RNA 2',3'-cyclic phosphodiesterase [Niallia nealsonii]PKG24944.1 RNA 2',3'-cyclic phosphodiesterase [Niallia nealsonii]
MSIEPHYFVAISLPDQVKEHIAAAKQALKHPFPFQKWVHPEDYHLTLAFLGSSSADQLQLLAEQLDKKICESDAFSLQIDRLGIFGNVAKPKIFWLGVKEEKKLTSLQNKVYDECKKVNFKLETRPFHPHITLARKWKESTFPIEALQQKNPFVHKDLSFSVQSIEIFQTQVNKEPKYEKIHTSLF